MRVSALRRSSFVWFPPRVGHVCEVSKYQVGGQESCRSVVRFCHPTLQVSVSKMKAVLSVNAWSRLER